MANTTAKHKPNTPKQPTSVTEMHNNSARIRLLNDNRMTDM
jgi:hypothetical protein